MARYRLEKRTCTYPNYSLGREERERDHLSGELWPSCLSLCAYRLYLLSNDPFIVWGTSTGGSTTPPLGVSLSSLPQPGNAINKQNMAVKIIYFFISVSLLLNEQSPGIFKIRNRFLAPVAVSHSHVNCLFFLCRVYYLK